MKKFLICFLALVSIGALFLMIGAVGGVERNTLPEGEGFRLALGALAVFGVSNLAIKILTKGGNEK